MKYEYWIGFRTLKISRLTVPFPTPEGPEKTISKPHGLPLCLLWMVLLSWKFIQNSLCEGIFCLLPIFLSELQQNDVFNCSFLFILHNQLHEVHESTRLPWYFLGNRGSLSIFSRTLWARLWPYRYDLTWIYHDSVSRPAWRAKLFWTPSKLFAISSKSWRRLILAFKWFLSSGRAALKASPRQQAGNCAFEAPTHHHGD